MRNVVAGSGIMNVLTTVANSHFVQQAKKLYDRGSAIVEAGIHTVDNGVRAVANGATFSGADYIAGAADTAVQTVAGKDASLTANMDAQRAASHEAKTENPVLYTAGNITGGLLTGTAIAKVAAAAPVTDAALAGLSPVAQTITKTTAEAIERIAQYRTMFLSGVTGGVAGHAASETAPTSAPLPTNVSCKKDNGPCR